MAGLAGQVTVRVAVVEMWGAPLRLKVVSSFCELGRAAACPRGGGGEVECASETQGRLGAFQSLAG